MLQRLGRRLSSLSKKSAEPASDTLITNIRTPYNTIRAECGNSNPDDTTDNTMATYVSVTKSIVLKMFLRC